jgi:hypothetical protein
MANDTLVQDTGIVSQFHGCWKMTHAVDSLFHSLTHSLTRTRTHTRTHTHTQRVKVKVIQQLCTIIPVKEQTQLKRQLQHRGVCVCVCENMYGYM